MYDNTEFRENHSDTPKEEHVSVRTLTEGWWAQYAWQGDTDPIIMSLGH